jgi:Protein of unknown function (DUF3995)
MTVTRLSASGLLAIAGLHVVWATGSSWPLSDGSALAEDLGGRPGGEPRTAGECLAVAGALTLASAFVAGRPRRAPVLSRIGAAGVAGTLATRGVFGLAGRTDVLVPGATSERFRALDRRYFSPLCLALALGALPAVAGSSGQRWPSH